MGALPRDVNTSSHWLSYISMSKKVFREKKSANSCSQVIKVHKFLTEMNSIIKNKPIHLL